MGNDTLPSLVTDNRFVIIPQWILFSGISDGALRLYAVLMKYAANDDKTAFPARSTLARGIRKSRDSVDRYVKELEDLGALTVQRRKKADSKQNQVNLYTIITGNPQWIAAPTRPPSRMDAAENYIHLTTPNSSIAFDHKIEPKPLSPSPSGDGHTLSEQLGTSKEVTRYLIDIILAIYSSGERFWSEDGYWVDLEAAFEEYLDLEAGDAIANRGWDARLEKIMRDNMHVGERYAASVYLGMLHNYVRSH